MNASKPVICSERMWRVPAQFSWVDLCLVTVANAFPANVPEHPAVLPTALGKRA